MTTRIPELDWTIEPNVTNFFLCPDWPRVTVIGFEHGRTESVNNDKHKHNEPFFLAVAEHHHEHTQREHDGGVNDHSDQ